jgi:hypothetical protein
MEIVSVEDIWTVLPETISVTISVPEDVVVEF